MPQETVGAGQPAASDIIIEALKIIKSEILAYAVIVAGLLIGTASFGIDILRELKWPLVAVFTVGLAAYFLARAVPKAKTVLRARSSGSAGQGGRPDDRR